MKKNQFVKTMLGTVLASAVCVSLFGCAPDTNGEPTVDEAGNTIIQIMVHVAQQSAEGMAYSRITDSFNASVRQRKTRSGCVSTTARVPRVQRAMKRNSLR